MGLLGIIGTKRGISKKWPTLADSNGGIGRQSCATHAQSWLTGTCILTETKSSSSSTGGAWRHFQVHCWHAYRAHKNPLILKNIYYCTRTYLSFFFFLFFFSFFFLSHLQIQVQSTRTKRTKQKQKMQKLFWHISHGVTTASLQRRITYNITRTFFCLPSLTHEKPIGIFPDVRRLCPRWLWHDFTRVHY